jgi:hypothetical protein
VTGSANTAAGIGQSGVSRRDPTQIPIALMQQPVSDGDAGAPNAVVTQAWKTPPQALR